MARQSKKQTKKQTSIEETELSSELSSEMSEITESNTDIMNDNSESLMSLSESETDFEAAMSESTEADEASTEQDIEIAATIFQSEEVEGDGFLPEISEEGMMVSDENEDEPESAMDLAGTELDAFESEEIEDIDFIEDERAESIIESILFASDRPVSFASISEVFKGTNIKKTHIRRILDTLAIEYAGGRRGVTLEEITGGYQLRTKIDNMNFLKSTVKSRPFKLSGPALETLSIVAYKQPVVKSEIDQIRGVESGHLLRALMEKGLVNFEGKAENLPGRPMQYGTTRRFLEIFGLRNIKELPTLSQIDELLPEGITEEEAAPTLSEVTDSMSEEVKTVSYSQGEEELGAIEDQLTAISTSSDFFEQEKIREKQRRDAEKAQDIRDALAVGEDVPTRDKNWLTKYEESLNPTVVSAEGSAENTTETETMNADDSNSENGSAAELMNTDAETSVDRASFSNEMSMIEDDISDDEEMLFADEEDEASDELPFYEEADEDGSESNESMA